MADYWKSQNKKWCESCKCWLTDNKSSVAFHESGNRHKMNVQQRLWDIQKKNKTDMKAERKLGNEMRKIEMAAAAASQKDMLENPDVSMKIQTYRKMLKEEGGGALDESTSPSKKLGQPTIVHRSEKQKKADDHFLADMKKAKEKSYRREGGWELPTSSKLGSHFLQLPSKSSKPAGLSLQLSLKRDEEKPVVFGEKRAVSAESTSTTTVKAESSDVLFKKRRLNKGSMRQRDESDT